MMMGMGLFYRKRRLRLLGNDSVLLQAAEVPRLIGRKCYEGEQEGEEKIYPFHDVVDGIKGS